MGVPSLFVYIASKYPAIFTTAASHTLCLDFNALIHVSNRSRHLDEQLMFLDIEAMIIQIVKIVNPRVLYIAADGVTPHAKMNQQRARRYVAADETLKSGKKYFVKQKDSIEKNIIMSVEKSEGSIDGCGNIHVSDNNNNLRGNKNYTHNTNDSKNSEISDTRKSSLNPNSTIKSSDIKTDDIISSLLDMDIDSIDSVDAEVWDSNCITPGTQFMQRLDAHLDLFFIKMMNTEWKSLSLIYSSSKVPGEGEHKITRFIRNTRPPTCTIYSPDADVLFLSMNLPSSVKVMREKMEKNKCTKCNQRGHTAISCGMPMRIPYIHVCIDKLKACVINDFKSEMRNKVDDDMRIIHDFIFICFLCGNDFLPTLPCFNVKFDAIEIISKELIIYYNKNCKFLINKAGEIEYKFLIGFFRQLASKEDRLYTTKSHRLKETRKKFDIKECEEIDLSTEKGKKEYYKNKLFKKVDNPSSNAPHTNYLEHDSKLSLFDNEFLKAREEVAKQYLLGLAWTHSLYRKEVLSWTWYYPYHYAPLASDLALVKDFIPSFTLGKPLSSLEQALLVLPPLSKYHVPEELHPIFDSCYFPSSFEIDMFDKLLPWQATVLLPFANVKEVKELFRSYKKDLSMESIANNMHGVDILYTKRNLGGNARRWWHGKSKGEIVDDVVNDVNCYVYEDGLLR